jgi:hypothetical protein
VTLAGPAYDADTPRLVATERAMGEALAGLPGVRGAAFAYDLPLEAHWLDSYGLSGSADGRDDSSHSAQLRIVGPGYFDAMDVALVNGRGFTENDTYASAGVAVVNEAFAARLLDGPALDRTLTTGSTSKARPDVTLPRAFRIVGIVEDERFRGLEQPSEPAVYLSTRQFPQQGLVMLVHTATDPVSLAGPARQALRTIAPDAPVGTMTTLASILAEQLVTRRATTHAIGGLATGALTLAALGVYGLLALLVASGLRETGIRLALGSSPRQEAGRVIRTCLTSAATGVGAGIVLALMGGRLLSSLLVDVSPGDAATLLSVAAVMLAVATLAAALPAWRASRVDPSTALRA